MKKIDYAQLYTLRSDGRYMGYYRDADGKRHAVYGRDPEKLHRRLEDMAKPQPVTFAAAAEAWEDAHAQRVGYKTMEAYTAPLRRIKDRYGDEEISSVTAQQIQALLSELGKQGFSRRSVQMHRDVLNMIFNHAIVSGVIQANPCAAVAMPRGLPTTPRQMPSDEALAVVAASTGEMALFAKLCLYAGLRRGEALALTYEDIDREQKLIHVTKAIEYIGGNPAVKTPKTAAGRRDVILLDALASQIPTGTGLIFKMDNGGPLTQSSFFKRWRRYCIDNGLDLSPHQLRHGYATILYEAGIADKDAQELLGHSSIAVTRDVYTHIRQRRRDETAKKLNAFVVGSVVKSTETVGT